MSYNNRILKINRPNYAKNFANFSVIEIWLFLNSIKLFLNKVAISFLALIFGGAVGNLIDRLRYGAVVDFLDFYFKEYHWPMFNVADSFICIGVFALILLPNGKSDKS